jgi:hypothetical protein
VANDISGRVWSIDTAAADVIYTGRIKVTSIAFVEYSAAAHTAIVKDANGNIVWSGKGNSEFSPVETAFARPLWIPGLIVDTIDSGRVLIATD